MGGVELSKDYPVNGFYMAQGFVPDHTEKVIPSWDVKRVVRLSVCSGAKPLF